MSFETLAVSKNTKEYRCRKPQYSSYYHKSKSGNDTKEFDAVDFIASITSHIPNKNEQTVRYYGYYSNVCRGRRKKHGACESDCVIEDDGYTKDANKSWARLIKKIYEVDPLTCSKCKGQMRIIAFIEDYLSKIPCLL